MLLGENVAMKNQTNPDLDALFHPARAYAHPRDVLADSDLTTGEKRAVLASWASDACAVEAEPALRHPPGGARPVQWDEIMDALRMLDAEAARGGRPVPRYKKVLGRSGLMWRRKPGAGDNGPIEHGSY
jgi:hypothetical protein